MSAVSLSDQRVGVQHDPYCFVVTVDTQPVLRCTARRDAFRYAVLVRRALRQADSLEDSGGSIGAPAGSLSPKRRLRPRGNIRH